MTMDLVADFSTGSNQVAGNCLQQIVVTTGCYYIRTSNVVATTRARCLGCLRKKRLKRECALLTVLSLTTVDGCPE